MAFLFGASEAQKRVELATSDLLLGPDWGTNVEICDMINRSSDKGKEFLKVLRKRIQNKNPKIARLALVLLGSCVKNCQVLHSQIAEDHFLNVLTKVGLKHQSKDVQEIALGLIVTWAETFSKVKKFPNFWLTYDRLRRSGVVFPSRKEDPPVLTPQRSIEPAPHVTPGAEEGLSAQERAMNPLSWCSPQYIGKLKRELQEVMNYVQVARDMIAAAETPEAVRSTAAIRDLVSVLGEMQKRLVRIIVEVENETAVDLCININEHVAVCLDWYKHAIKDAPYSLPDLRVPKAIYELLPEERAQAAPAAAAREKGLEQKADPNEEVEGVPGDPAPQQDILHLEEDEVPEEHDEEQDAFLALAKRDEVAVDEAEVVLQGESGVVVNPRNSDEGQAAGPSAEEDLVKLLAEEPAPQQGDVDLSVEDFQDLLKFTEPEQ